MAIISNGNKTIWENQVELTKSSELLDEQFAVSTRLMVLSVNKVAEAAGMVDRIDADDIEAMFKLWAMFRSRSDFREYMLEWMLEPDLSTLPKPPEPVGDQDAESDNGDEDLEEERSQNSTTSPQDDVPQVQG